MDLVVCKASRTFWLGLFFAALGPFSMLLSGCGSAISAFIGSQHQEQEVTQVPGRWGESGITLSSGRSFSSSSEMSADYILSPRHRKFTSSAVSAEISMNQSRGKLNQ